MTTPLFDIAHCPEGLKLILGPLYSPKRHDAYDYWPQGALVINAQGHIVAVGHASEVLARLFGPDVSLVSLDSALPSSVALTRYDQTHLLIPGLMDLHTHLPQWAVRARCEPNLLTWLDAHILPEEVRFTDRAYAQQVAEQFFDALVACGTTTTALFLTSHPHVVDMAFETACRKGVRVVTGLNLMDTQAPYPGPAALTESPQTLLAQTEALCQRWHNHPSGLVYYAWMPRFALSCSSELLAGLGQLRERYPDVWCHTHLAEQPGEVAAVLAAYPSANSYTQVYDQFGLLGPRTLLAHGIHLDNDELARIRSRGASLVHCPSANFFLKSGVFRWDAMAQAGVSFGLGSDVGAGYSLWMGDVMRDAYMIQPELNISIHALLYRATLGAAEALGLQATLGCFAPGKHADLVVLKHGHGGLKPSSVHQFLADFIFTGDNRWMVGSMVQGTWRT